MSDNETKWTESHSSLSTTSVEDRLKLFVIGETSGNPKDWSAYGFRILVLAHNEEEALRFNDGEGDVAEVNADGPVILCREEYRGN
jgi:hypothetical protein